MALPEPEADVEHDLGTSWGPRASLTPRQRMASQRPRAPQPNGGPQDSVEDLFGMTPEVVEEPSATVRSSTPVRLDWVRLLISGLLLVGSLGLFMVAAVALWRLGSG